MTNSGDTEDDGPVDELVPLRRIAFGEEVERERCEHPCGKGMRTKEASSVLPKDQRTGRNGYSPAKKPQKMGPYILPGEN